MKQLSALVDRGLNLGVFIRKTMEQGIGEPGEFHPAKSRIEVIGREHQPVQGHDAGQAKQYIAGIRLARAHGIIGIGIRDQESAQHRDISCFLVRLRMLVGCS